MRSSLIAPALSTLLALPSLHAQGAIFAPELQPGARVRIDAPGILAGRLTTTVISRSRDSVTVRARERRTLAPGEERLTTLTVGLDRITRVEMSRGRSRLLGGVVGAASAAAVGIAIVSLDNRAPQNCILGCKERPSNSERLLDGARIGATVGGILGLGIGRERWRRLELAPRVSLRAGGRGGMLALSAQF